MPAGRGGGWGGGATGYCSNDYENQSNKLIIILNQSTYCYSFTSISNKTEINYTTGNFTYEKHVKNI